MKRISLILLSLAGLAFAACEEELVPGTPLYPVEEESFTGVKVYVNEIQNNNVYKSVYNSTPLFVEIPEDTASFHVQVNIAQEAPIVVKASLTGLPDGTWKFVEGHEQVTIPAGEKTSSSDIRLVLLESSDLIHMEEYTNAKVTLEVVSGPAEVGENLNTFTWNIRNRYTIIYLGTIDGLEDKQFVGGTDWTPYSSSSYTDRFYDGVYSSYIYLTTSPAATVPSMYVDLNSPAPIEGIGFVPYGTSETYLTRYWPGEAEFYISNDAETWTSVGVVQFNVGEASTWQVVRFYEPTKARYIGCKFNRNYGNYSSSVYFSEVGVFGDLTVREIYTSPESAYVRVGKTIRLSAAQRPVNAPETLSISWTSEDPSVATVDADGNVTGVAPGATRIVARGGAFESMTTLVVRENVAPEFFGNYTVEAATSSSATATPQVRKIEILKADDSHVTFRFTDEAQKRVINGKDTWLIGTLPFEKIDDDHYRIVWKAGTIFATDFLTGSDLPVPKVYTCMYRGTGTSATYRSIADTSVDVDFAYDEITGKFKGTFGETHDWTYETAGIGLAYDYINASGREYTNQSWLVMWGGDLFSFTKD